MPAFSISIASSPAQSFLQLTIFNSVVTENCMTEIPLCLPVYSLADIRFQFKLSVAYQNDIDMVDRKFYLVPCDDCELEAGVDLDTLFDSFYAELNVGLSVQGGATTGPSLYFANVVNWANGPIDNYFECEDCFKLCLVEVEMSGDTMVRGWCKGYSNNFCKICDPCDTAVIRYRCDEDSLGFFYEGNSFLNRIRLPFHLKNPQLPGEESGYMLSNGLFRKLSERINKLYELHTDYMPIGWHEKLRTALSHDTIQIEDAYTGINNNVYRDANYDIEWIEDTRHPHATAQTKVYILSGNPLINTNC